ncbi:preQ(1) synthase [Candidatus Peregrinibacteria bacterium CG10_big_fil_rev_8_21_14_0_10_36_19]|nr:MAG: preQ(1) synthase [Candidatus Peregrinibacteria bacterium CG10_big_fil_rev_8_21_14_0_10_36_19]
MSDTTFKQYEENEDYKERSASEIRSEIKKEAPLLSFEFQEQGEGEHWVTIASPEFTAICPFSNWPDFGSVEIQYVPNKKCLELKSFKIYINSYRNVKVFHETVTEIIFADFLEAVEPKKAKIVVDMNVRGNIKTICKKYYNCLDTSN